ncbi:MAG: ATP-binding cassette domain-containing protein, partial [Lachnospiraceae bacterium]
MNDSYYLFADRNKKRKYSVASNFLFLEKQLWKFDKIFVAAQLGVAVTYLVGGYIGNILPAAIVEGLEYSKSITEILGSILFLGVLLLITNVLSYIFLDTNEVKRSFLGFYLTKSFIDKNEGIDYELKEAKGYQEIYSNAWNSANNGRGFYEGSELVEILLWASIGIGMYGCILGKRSLIVLLLVLVSVGVNLYLLSVARKVHKKYYGKISKYAKGVGYISEITMDQTAGKDIRIYNMLDFILKKYDRNLEQIGKHYGRIHNWYLFRNASGAVLSFLRDAAAYIYLVRELYLGNISAAEFVFLIGVIATLAEYFERFLRVLMSWNTLDSSVTYFRDYLATESCWAGESEIGEQTLKEMKSGGIELELKDVSYTYEGADSPAISHFNLKIRKGEKLALIGLNGAGKTTLVKLICGLYTPDTGTIIINGIDRKRFTKEEYFSLMSVMFQDSYFLPVSLDENMTGEEKPNQERLAKALELSGFLKAYMKLDNKGQSRLIKKLEETAVDFSGGEKQKLIFARAIYRRTPLVILDEPTAALDPIAEHELYCNFKEAVDERTC